MKRIGCLIAALSLLMTLSACHTGGEAEPTLRIGVALYQQEDTFIETVTRELQRVALEKEQAQNCKINLYITDGKESQTSQNEQVDRFLERGYDVICVNIVDRTAAAVIVLLSVYTIGTTVRYDGINLGTVGSRRTVDQAVQQLETVTRQTLEDQDYAIDTALLSTQTHVVPRRDLESREEFAENLTDQIGDVTYGYTLYVDGEAVAATTYAGAIDQLLEQMKAGYITENTVDCSFVETRGDQGGLCGQLPDLQPGLYR